MNFVITKTIRKPGQKGTKRLLQIYGDDLICVRYKYDYKNKKKYKTIELKTEEHAWEPSQYDPFVHKRVYVRVLPYEKKMRAEIKISGGIWNSEKKLWKIPMRVVWELNLEDRIVQVK